MQMLCVYFAFERHYLNITVKNIQITIVRIVTPRLSLLTETMI